MTAANARSAVALTLMLLLTLLPMPKPSCALIVTAIIAIYSNGHDLALTYARELESKLGGQLHYGQL